MKLTITRGWAKLRVKEGVVPTQYVYTRAATGNTWSVSADTLRNEGLYAGVYCSHGVQASFNISVRCHGNILFFVERVLVFQYVNVVLSPAQTPQIPPLYTHSTHGIFTYDSTYTQIMHKKYNTSHTIQTTDTHTWHKYTAYSH